ncbi:erythromycin esterase family protein [Actinomadura sp. WMMB 499]|uniref:erythromycin esterase family protein n=1 Tax=Actinomadura sp. WMMB 499 TaxID=1219491 RepID=UPI00159DABD2|nr:erythromycin esterase family protein [Actinomadura sp. WMMB 499]
MTSEKTVAGWIAGAARPVRAGTADGPRTDLEPLRDAARDAAVVAVATATRGAHEQFVLQDRAFRFLVEELGFRTLALEEDWTTGLRLDAYARTGRDDPAEALRDAWLPWQTAEILDALRWIRSFNERHPDDPVRIIGLDFHATREAAYDAVEEHVRRGAPGRAAELAGLLAPLRPSGPIDEHVARYRALPDKQPLIERAERALALVRSLPVDPLAVRHAQAIADFHHLHAMPVLDIERVEARFAESILWWHEQTGAKVVYWGGTAHASAGEAVLNGELARGKASRDAAPGPGPTRTNAGGRLRRRLGARFVPIGLTFDHGAVHGGVSVPSPPAAFGDAVLGTAGPPHYLLDLREARTRTDGVGAWLRAPAPVRVIGPGYRPGDDAGHNVQGGAPGTLFDVLIHSQEVTPARPLP